MAIDIYTPSMPHMVRALSTSVAMIQWSMVIYLIAMGVAEFIAGVVSDYYGRRWTLLISVVLFLLGSVICACSHEILWLLIGRFIQGCGAGMQVIMTAIVSDCYHGKRLTKITSYMSLGWSLMPILAPAVGGFLQQHFDWQASFLVMGVYALIALGLAYAWLPETFPTQKRNHISLLALLGSLSQLMLNRVFIVAVMLMILMWAVMMLFNVMTPFLFETQLGMSAQMYGMMALIYGAAYFIGAMINVRLLKWLTVNTLITTGLWIFLLSSLWLLLTGWLQWLSLTSIMPPLLIAVASTGLVFPHCLSKAMQQFNRAQAGIGSALMSSLIILGTAAITICTANLQIHSQTPLALCYTAIALFSVLLKYFYFS